MQEWLCIDESIISQSLPRPYTAIDLGFSCSSSVTNQDYIVRENFEHLAIYNQEGVSIRINNNFQENYKISLFNILGQQTRVLYDDIIDPG